MTRACAYLLSEVAAASVHCRVLFHLNMDIMDIIYMDATASLSRFKARFFPHFDTPLFSTSSDHPIDYPTLSKLDYF